MTLEEALAEIEEVFACGEGRPYASTANGQPYLTVVSGGVKGEGCNHPALYADEDLAIEAWRNAVLAKKPSGQRGKLWWRCKPELHIFPLQLAAPSDSPISPIPVRVMTYFAVYSRLAIEEPS